MVAHTFSTTVSEFLFPFQKFLNLHNMSNFSIFPPISMLLFYSYIFLLLFLYPQQLSDPNLVGNSLKTASFRFRAVPSQVSTKISSPSTIFLPFPNRQKITNKILHSKIILFYNNSFAILGIPYLQMISSSTAQSAISN